VQDEALSASRSLLRTWGCAVLELQGSQPLLHCCGDISICRSNGPTAAAARAGAMGCHII
jgi:hypothetical protein